jgi:hypothetical protein
MEGIASEDEEESEQKEDAQEESSKSQDVSWFINSQC